MAQPKPTSFRLRKPNLAYLKREAKRTTFSLNKQLNFILDQLRNQNK